MLDVRGAARFGQFMLLACLGTTSTRLDAQPAAAEQEHSASYADLVTRTLVADGFANVATMVEGQRVFVTFENTRYRDLRRGLGEVAARLLPALEDGELVLVPTVDGVPLGTARYAASVGDIVRAESDTVDAAVPEPRTSLNLAGVPDGLLSAPPAGSSFGRVDVVMHPWFEANFSNVNPVAARTGIAPEARLTLRRGLTVSAQVLFTLYDDVPTGESRVRPGLLTVKQRFRPRDGVFVAAVAGAFNPNRYGIDVEARAYSASGRLSAGMEVALTGAVSYGAQDWYYAPMDDATVLADVAWRLLSHGLTVRATGGWFTPAEPTLRLDVTRQFGATEIGFFAVQGEQEANFGFRLVVPLPGTRYPAPGRYRVRMAERFSWEYRYHGRSVAGRQFRTGVAIDDELRQWTAP